MINILQKKYYNIELTNNDKEFILANPHYMSLITINDIKCPEEIKYLHFRVNFFIKYLINIYKDTNKNILIASHASVLSEIENCKYDQQNKLYPQGGLILLYENAEYCCKPITL